MAKKKKQIINKQINSLTKIDQFINLATENKSIIVSFYKMNQSGE